MAGKDREQVGALRGMFTIGTTCTRVVPMALNVKDEEAVRLAGEIAALTGESKTRAIRVALQERLERLVREQETPAERKQRLIRFLEEEVWPTIPEELRGKPPTKAEREEILGIGEHGY